MQAFSPHDYSLREQDLIEPERHQRRQCGRFCPCRLSPEPEPLPRGTFRAGQGMNGVILNCHHILTPGMLYCVDAAGESRCESCDEEAD